MKIAPSFALVFAAFTFLFCDLSVAQSPDSALLSKTTLKKPQVETVIKGLCSLAKSSYNSAFREYSGEEPNEELAQAERDYFEMNCDQVAASFSDYVATGSLAAFDELVRALGEVRYYQPKSSAVFHLTNVLREHFSEPNLYVEASERFVSALAGRQTSEKYPVQETIRGALARGNGSTEGEASLQLFPNDDRAELAFVLNMRVASSVVSASPDVDVYTDSFGNITATKKIFIESNGTFSASPSIPSGRMKTTVRSINPKRSTPFGGRAIQNRVLQEIPYSEQETTQRVNQHVASELDKELDSLLTELNRRVQRMAIDSDDSVVNRLSTKTSDSRLFFSCVLGKNWQLAVPIERRKESPPVARRTEQLSSTNMRLQYASPSLVSAVDSSPEDDYDVLMKLHQSVPNNLATVALADASFGSGINPLDTIVERFPAFTSDEVREFLTRDELKDESSGDLEDSSEDFLIRFDEVRPFTTQFEDGKIATSFHIASCVSDGKEWPPVEVQFVYHVEKRGDSYAFVRETVEVLPEGYQEGDSVSARFHTFRRIFMKRLEKTIQDEYVVVPVSLDDPQTGEKRGALVPSYVDINDGWVVLGFRFDPDYQK